jgi:hypothetical protein
MTRREKLLLSVFIVIAAVAVLYQSDENADDLAFSPPAGKRSPTLASAVPPGSFETSSELTARQNQSALRSDGKGQPSQRFPDAPAGTNLFPGQSESPPADEQPLRPPEPPEFPFDYLGVWREQGVEIVFFSLGDQLLRVRQGDMLQKAWRLDQISQQQLVFTYMPLKMTKTMRIPQ